MGIFNFLKPKKKTTGLDSEMKEMANLTFPGGYNQVQEESEALYALLRGKLSKSESESLLTRTKSLMVIAKDKSRARIAQSILNKTGGKLTPPEAELAYQFFAGISDEK